MVAAYKAREMGHNWWSLCRLLSQGARGPVSVLPATGCWTLIPPPRYQITDSDRLIWTALRWMSVAHNTTSVLSVLCWSACLEGRCVEGSGELVVAAVAWVHVVCRFLFQIPASIPDRSFSDVSLMYVNGLFIPLCLGGLLFQKKGWSDCLHCGRLWMELIQLNEK